MSVDNFGNDSVDELTSDMELLSAELDKSAQSDYKSGADSGVEGSELANTDGQVQLTPELRDRIIERIEFYFSNDYLMGNSFLTKHIKKNREGYVSITLITSFKKVKCLTRDWNVVAEALKYSTKLEVNQEGKKVKRKDPLPEYLKVAAENKGIKTVVAYNLPPKYSSIGGVSNLFSKYGEILLARIVRPSDDIPEDLKPAKAHHSQLGQETCAFIEFDKPDHALRCIEGLTKSDNQELDGICVTLLNLKIKQSVLDRIKEMENKAKSDSASQDEKEKKAKRKKKKNKRLDELLNVRDDVSTCSSDDAEGAPRRRSAPISIGKDSGRGTLGPDKNRLFDFPRGNSPKNSYDSWKKSDYSSDSCAHSPWSRRPRSDGGSPRASPLPSRRSFSRTNKIQMEGVIRPPIGPDGTRGFKIGRGTRPIYS